MLKYCVAEGVTEKTTFQREEKEISLAEITGNLVTIKRKQDLRELTIRWIQKPYPLESKNYYKVEYLKEGAIV